jgi:arylsulfatase A-like enzyme
MYTEMDAGVGLVVAALKANNRMWDNTVLV